MVTISSRVSIRNVEGRVRKLCELGDEGTWGSLTCSEPFELGKDILPKLVEAALRQLCRAGLRVSREHFDAFMSVFLFPLARP